MLGQESSINTVSLLSQAVWLNLSLATRQKLVKLFSLPKTGTPMVSVGAQGATVISDGYSIHDFASITVWKMQALLNEDSEDFYYLFDNILDNLDELLDNGGLVLKIKGHGKTKTVSQKQTTVASGPEVKRKGRPTKENSK